MDQLYVIILDIDVTNTKFWVYVANAKTLADIKKVTNYSSKNRPSLSKNNYRGTEQGSTTLTCTDDDSKATAKIYLLKSTI